MPDLSVSLYCVVFCGSVVIFTVELKGITVVLNSVMFVGCTVVLFCVALCMKPLVSGVVTFSTKSDVFNWVVFSGVVGVVLVLKRVEL